MRSIALLAAMVLLACGPAVARRLAEPAGADEQPQPWISPLKTSAPLIGVLAQACHYCPGKSWIAAGFVKWIEAAGARAVPIRFYHSDDELHRQFRSVNGLIFPGGLTDLWMDDPYVVAARKLWNWAREANDAGEVFPIHGTCLGFQLLHILESNVSFTKLLVDTDSVAHASTLDFTPAARSSRLFGGMDEDLFEKLPDPAYNISMENHMFGLPPAHYQKWPVLDENWTILTTTKDRNGLEYISSAEHKVYPFTATQWHPEKPPYEFGMKEIPHSLDAVRVSQHLANIFIETARHSSHKPESHEQEIELLIYNWKPYFTLRDSLFDFSYDGPDMCYFFDQQDEPSDANRLPASRLSTSFEGRVLGFNELAGAGDAPQGRRQEAVLRRGGRAELA